MSQAAQSEAYGYDEAIQHELSDKTARDNIAEYLREESMTPESYDSMPDAQKRIIADSKLLVYMEEIDSEGQQTDRDKLVAFFEEHNWLPKTGEEAAAALPKGLKVAGLKKPGKKRTQKGKEAEFVATRQFNEDAFNDLLTFGEIGVHTKGRDKPLNPSWLRQSRKGQYMIADAYLAREFLRRGEWLKPGTLEYDQRQSYWRGLMLLAAEHASSNVLAEVLGFFFDKANERLRQASRQYSAAGHRLGRPILKSTSGVESIKETKKIVVKTNGPFDINNYIPPEDKARMDKRLAERAAMVERLDSMGMPEWEKKRRIDEAFPEFIPPEEQMRRERIAEFKARGTSPPTSRHRSNPALSPSVRSRPGYDKRPDK